MTTNPKTILAISIGSRSMGIAVVCNAELVTAKVHSFKGHWSKSKLVLILGVVKKYVGQHKAEKIVLKVPSRKSSSIAIRQLIHQVEFLAKKHRLSIAFCSIVDLHKKFYSVHDGKNASASLIAIIASRYPELQGEFKKQQVNRNPYYYKLFEAVAAAILDIE